ncbi:hypothetical protein IWW51_000586, partial [Coemansia sp. RSA 2702]
TLQTTIIFSVTATAQVDGQNPTATMVITPQYYTETQTIHDTVTTTVQPSEAGAAPAKSQEPLNEVADAQTTTETVTVTVSNSETIMQSFAEGNIATDGIDPITITQVMLTTVEPDAS